MPERTGGGPRGEVVGFSRESRKRLMQLFASLDSSIFLANSTFITLTYHREWSDDPAVWKDDLRRFIQKLERAYGPHPLIWRLEFQKRAAPHWHLIVIGDRPVTRAWVIGAWAPIAHKNSEFRGEYGVDVQPLDSIEKVGVYVAKYVAKNMTGTIPRSCGRVWGVRHAANLPITLLQTDLDYTSGDQLKAAMIDTMDPEKVHPWLRKSRGGAWTMLPMAEALQLVHKSAAGWEAWEVVDRDAILPGLHQPTEPFLDTTSEPAREPLAIA